MEFLTILLSALIGVVSPAGLIVDRVAANAIRDQFDAVETLAVRVDNTPSYQLAQGKVDRVRIAGRGLFPQPGLRIDTLEVETDAIAISPRSLRAGEPELARPLQAGVRLVLTEADLNQALQSPLVAERLQNIAIDLPGSSAEPQRYDVVNPHIEFLGGDRLRFQATLRQQNSEEQLAIVLETGASITSGRQIQLIDPTLLVNDQSLPSFLIQGLASGIAQRFDLQNFQESGITARILTFAISPDALQVAAFVRVEPEAIAGD
jgi:LmeA-like phospholipid-binding